MLLFRNKVPQ